MKFNLSKMLLPSLLFLGLLFSSNVHAQSACCANSKKDKTACTTKAKSNCAPAAEATSGCTPSACRGAQTKFGEAKVISQLRLSLIELKADMEKSERPRFDARSYDIHGIVGDTDEESLAIIAKELEIVEEAFANVAAYKAEALELPKNKAKQVQYLNTRIERLKNWL